MRLVVAVVGLILILGCGAYTPQPGEQTTASADTDGEKIYRRQCRNCHSLPKPGSHTDDEWPPLINRHSKRVKLTEEQTKALLAYLREHN